MEQRLAFRPHARIVRTLGDQLVSGESAALIELVKNSYDADASWCSVTIDPEANEITVEDDGHGMSMEDIQRNWAEIGTDGKSGRSMSRSGNRKILGNKGIGRLAAAKLGRYLEIESTVEGSSANKTIKVTGIDWNSFLKGGENKLDEMTFLVERFSPKKSTGTLIKISDLLTAWKKENLMALTLDLRKLVSPIEQHQDGFKIYLNLDKFMKKGNSGFDGYELLNDREKSIILKKENTNEKNLVEPFPILDACDYIFKGKFKKNKLKGILTIRESQLDFNISVKIKGETDCGAGSVNLHIFSKDEDSTRNAVGKTETKLKTSKTKIKSREARRHLKNLSGISIYRNKFRIRPYGDHDVDWLGLNKRNTQNPSMRIDHALISGVITIEGEEKSGLIEMSSREGFEHNNSYISLKHLMLGGIQKIEQVLYEHNSEVGGSKELRNETVESSLDKISSSKSLERLWDFSSYISSDQKENFGKSIEDYTKELNRFVDVIRRRQSVLDARTTLGFILADIVHDIWQPTSVAGANLRYLVEGMENGWKEKMDPEVASVLLREHQATKNCVHRIQNLLKQMNPLIKTVSKQPEHFSIFQSVKKSLCLFERRANELGIKIKNIDPGKDLHIMGIEGDLETAVINIVDNAFYWLGAREIKTPFVEFNYNEAENYVVLEIKDNAGGAPKMHRDSIFDVGFTEKPNGCGLGLSIAREAIGRSGGAISYESLKNGSLFKIKIGKGL